MNPCPRVAGRVLMLALAAGCTPRPSATPRSPRAVEPADAPPSRPPAAGASAVPAAIPATGGALIASGLVAPAPLAVDADWLFFASGTEADQSLFRVGKAGGQAQRLAALAEGWRPECGVAADQGSLFFVTQQAPQSPREAEPPAGGGGLGSLGSVAGGGPGTGTGGHLVRVSKTGGAASEIASGRGSPCNVTFAAGRLLWTEGGAVRSADADGGHKLKLFESRGEDLQGLLARGDDVVVVTSGRVVRLAPRGEANRGPDKVLATGDQISCGHLLDDAQIAYQDGDSLFRAPVDGARKPTKMSDSFRVRCGAQFVGDRWVHLSTHDPLWRTSLSLASEPLPGASGERVVVQGMASERFLVDERWLYVARQAPDGVHGALLRLERTDLQRSLQQLAATDAAPWALGPDPLSAGPRPPWTRYEAGVLSTSAVRNALDGALPEMARSCMSAQEVPPVLDEIRFLIFVEPDGQVGDVAIAATEQGHFALESCLRRRIKHSIHFTAAPRSARILYSLGGRGLTEDETHPVDGIVEPGAALSAALKKSVVRGCDPLPGGGLRATLYVDEEGSVRSVGLSAPIPIPDAVGGCAVNQIQGWRLPGAPRHKLAKGKVDL